MVAADFQGEELGRKVIELICDAIGASSEEVTPDSSLSDDLGMESLDLVELIMEVEDVFEVEITDDELEALKTVDDMIDHVRTTRLSA